MVQEWSSKGEMSAYPCRLRPWLLLRLKMVPFSYWKTLLAAGNGVVVVVLGGDEGGV